MPAPQARRPRTSLAAARRRVAAAAAACAHLLTRPDPNLCDGRYANNPWLQELPRPVGKLVWDNPLLLAPATAARAGLANGDEVVLQVGTGTVRTPVWISPGQSEDCVVAWLGGGRTAAGAVGNGVGIDVTPLRGLDAVPVLRRTGRRVRIASTDHHNMLEVDKGTVDHIVRHGTLAEFAANPRFLHGAGREPEIYPPARTAASPGA